MNKKRAVVRKILIALALVSLFLLVSGGGCQDEEEDKGCNQQLADWNKCIEGKTKPEADEQCGSQPTCT